jgi:hypothetical protein
MAISVSSEAHEGQELLQEVNEDLEAFETFFRNMLGNTHLTPSEKAILKTYLHWAVVEKMAK